MRFRSVTLMLPMVLFSAPAFATIPTLNATCPTGIDVHADQGGPVYINGKHAKLKKFSNNYFEAKSGHTTISIMLTEDGSVEISYTGPNRANGVCQIVVYHGAPEDGSSECPADVSEADRYKYPACN